MSTFILPPRRSAPPDPGHSFAGEEVPEPVREEPPANQAPADAGDEDLPTIPIPQKRPWLRSTDPRRLPYAAADHAPPEGALDDTAAVEGSASLEGEDPPDDTADPIFLRSFGDFLRSFQSDEDCAEYLYTLRFPHGFCCPVCEVRTARESDDGLTMTCTRGHRVELAAGTVLEGSTVPLAVWFRAAYVLVTSHPDLSVTEFRDQLGIARLDLALLLRSRLRSALSGNGKVPFVGEVEVGRSVVLPDEGPPILFAGALEIARWRDELGRTQEVGNRVAMRVLPAWTREHALRFVGDHVAPGTLVHTVRDPALDELDRVGYRRKVQLAAGVPRLENLFASLHLAVRSIEPGPLTPYRTQAILNDYGWRFNRRGSRWAAFNRSLGIPTPASALFAVDTLEWIARDCRRPMALAVGQ